MSHPRLLLFGSNGAIGRSIAKYFLEKNWQVIGTTRKQAEKKEDNLIQIQYNPFKSPILNLENYAPYDAVCWAQGVNINDSIYDMDYEKHLEVYKANCLYILISFNNLLKESLVTNPARFCVISSIWQNISRQNKLSYSVSKAAIQGLINSVTTDLAKDKFLINAVLPGALDTEMTRTSLKNDQIKKLKDSTLFKSLPNIGDVSSLVYFLCSQENTSITGQFIAVDLGFSNARIL